ncbi:hypothetical protein ACN469_31775 [Corallococcus terminator]
MFVRRSWAVVLLLLLPSVAWTEASTTPHVVPEGDALAIERDEEVPLEPVSEARELEPEAAPPSTDTTEAGSRWTRLLRMEATSLTLLPRRGAREDEGLVQLEPTVRLAKRGTFRLNLGAPVRLRLWGGGEGAGPVRREDWDTLSDWGQVVRSLTVGGDAPNFLWVGALESYTLLSGHLVRRYNNRGNPDYCCRARFLMVPRRSTDRLVDGHLQQTRETTGVHHERARPGVTADDGLFLRRFSLGNRRLQLEPEHEAAQGCPAGTAARRP